jgi:hypothetical protein
MTAMASLSRPGVRSETVRSKTPRARPPAVPWRSGTYIVLTLVAFAQGAVMSGRHTVSWRYFVRATDALFSGQGLHVFARHPELQFGPFAIVVSGVIRVASGSAQRIVVAYLLTALLIPILVLVEQTAIGYGADPRRARHMIFLGGLLVIPGWNEVAVRTAHIDDALALAAMVVAGWAVTKSRPVVAGVALALAVDSKPWALAFVPLLLVFHGRERRLALSACSILICLAWAPFLIADHHTLNAAKYTIPNDAASALRWIGVHNARTPFWDRPVQFVLGGAVAAFVVWRRQWPAVLLGAMAIRLLLDPANHHYYSAGILLGALLFDTAIVRRRIPWTTLIAFACIVVPWPLVTVLSADHVGEALAFGTLIPLALVVLSATTGLPVDLLRRPRGHGSPTSNTGWAPRLASRRRAPSAAASAAASGRPNP